MDSVKDVLLNEGYSDMVSSGHDYVIKCWNWENHKRGDKVSSLRIDKHTGSYHCFACGERGSLEKKFGAHIDPVDGSIHYLIDKMNNPAKYREDLSLEIPNDAVYDNSYWIDRGISQLALGTEDVFLSPILDKRAPGGSVRTWIAYRDLTGEIFGIEGRSHNDRPKYVFLGKKKMYPRDPEVYNGCVIGVEGIGDLLNLRTSVLYNVITGFRSGGLLKEDINSIRGLKRLLIAYDSDESGMRANNKLKDLYANTNIEVEIVKLPEGKDPGSLTTEEIDKYFIRQIYG